MKTIFFDVDTQKDFMNKDGALYVPEAEKIKPALKKITEYARKNAYSIMGSVDTHFSDDAELKENGGPFPEHCMKGTRGAKKIRETFPKMPLYVPSNNSINVSIESHLNEGGEVFFEKQNYDVFTNPHLEQNIKDVKLAIVYGVATDYCIKSAAIGLSKRGITTYILTDAIKAVSPKTEKIAFEEMEESGVKFIQFKDLEKIINGD